MTQNIEISVTLSPELRLEQALKQAGVEDPATVTHLTIEGKITNNDMRYILENMRENLKKLDYSSKLDTHSLEELEEFAYYLWNDEIKDYWNGRFLGVIMYNRKSKLNQQFIFNKDSIEAIVHIDKQLKKCCQKLKEETEKEFIRLFERQKANEIKSFAIYGSIIPYNNNFILSNVPRDYREEILTFQLEPPFEKDNINLVSIFDITTNYADEIGLYNSELTSHHVGYAFYKLHSDSCLSLQDIIEIEDIKDDIMSIQELDTIHQVNVIRNF